MRARSVVRGLSTVFLLWFAAPDARAQALRRFEDAHAATSSSSSSSSRSSSRSSSSSRSAGGSVVAEVLQALFSGSSSSSSSSSAIDSPSVGYRPSYRPSAVIYGRNDSAYVMPYRLEEDTGLWKRTSEAVRYGELRLGGFSAASDRVFGHDLTASGWAGLFVLRGSWERLYEPRSDLGTTDTLDIYRAQIGANLLGSSVKPVELYLLAGGGALDGQRLTPAFDGALEMRAYPFDPVAFYTSMNVSLFAHGQPLLDGRFEMGASLGRFDLRAGIRGLKQEPAQSFFGPVVTLSLRI